MLAVEGPHDPVKPDKKPSWKRAVKRENASVSIATIDLWHTEKVITAIIETSIISNEGGHLWEVSSGATK